MSRSTDRDLLFGLLALQNNFIDRDALLDAFSRWVHDQGLPLGQILRDRGALEPDDYELLQALVAKHLKKYGDDPQKSLQHLSSIRSIRDDLSRIADPDVQASLAQVAAARQEQDDDPYRTVHEASVGVSSSVGTRFRILRPHAKGGLGEVFVALDTELNRDVALKEIQDQFADDPRYRARFEFEAEVTGGLEHPGIVPVYGLGTYADGRPFYAMRFIRGNSLKEAIARFHADGAVQRAPGGRTLALQKLLLRFLDVCNAVSYAHSRGVLHRDLKPANIMLGDYGETLVVDWGLAKAVGHHLEPAVPLQTEGTLRPESGSELQPTVVGQRLGTPGYMPPEQAAGRLDELGAPSDVYSLGATLYALLTGRPPFTEPDLLTLLRQVKQGEFPRPRQVRSWIDPALEAVCLKAMSRRLQDRYASPKTLADEIEHWLADEPVSAYREPFSVRARRWMQRHRTATTAGLLAGLVLLGALGVGYRRETIYAANLAKENRRAEDREALAIDAVRKFRDAVVTNPDLKNRADLKPLREALLKEPLNFFRTLRDQMQSADHTRPEALYRLSHAGWDLADTIRAIGNQTDALRASEEARSIMERLARENPTNTTFQWRLAANHNNVGVLQRDLGQTTAAIVSFQKALAIRERLARDEPAGTELEDVRVFRARIHGNIGKLQGQQGQPTTALESFQKALVIWEELALEIPAFENHVADTHGNIGNQQRALGQTTAAIVSYEKALVILEGLARDNPANTGFQQSLAAINSSIGLLRIEQGQPAAAIMSFQEALAIQERLVRNEPTITGFQSDLSNTYNNVGAMQRALGQPAAAVESFQKAVAIRERLSQDNHAVTRYQWDLANSYNNIGVMRMTMNQPAAAIESFQKAAMILEGLARDNPTNTMFQYSLAASHYNTGVQRVALGQIIASLESFRKAVAILERLAQTQPSNAGFQSLLAKSYTVLAASHTIIGVLRMALGQTIASLESFQKSLTIIFKLLLTRHLNGPVLQDHLGWTQTRFGDFHGERKRLEEPSRSIARPGSTDGSRWRLRLGLCPFATTA
jgi:serine/threonine-protein kinase